MAPHIFVVGAVTDAARKAIEQVGGTIEVTTNGNLVILPSEARMGANNWDKPRDHINTCWYHIEVAGLTLQSSSSQEDRDGTLGLAEN